MFKLAKSTGDLFTELKDDKNLSGYLRRNQEEFVMPLGEYLEKLLTEKNLTKKEVIKRSDLNREYVYHIFSGLKKNPSRPKILAIAMAMELDLDEIQYLLRYAGFGLLYPRNQWDAIIISAVEQKFTVAQTNELLYRLGEKTLGD
ncbi:MAG: helix-turn-helix domain-containing protein [Selenomonadaceae bacterium]|nr:helix-turn-helix domain-containing protein [Selenomonadaceae bacterium]